jgi:putative Mn2+ efflux pump MntP
MLGRVLGEMVGKRAEMIGGVILIGVGAVILCGEFNYEVQHLTT